MDILPFYRLFTKKSEDLEQIPQPSSYFGSYRVALEVLTGGLKLL